jgi:hypothetical protein
MCWWRLIAKNRLEISTPSKDDAALNTSQMSMKWLKDINFKSQNIPVAI